MAARWVLDRLTAWMVRASFVWLVAGVALGAMMLADRRLPSAWIGLWLPTHVHMLLVGWLLQFVLAIAYWLFPRKRTAERPVGYDERFALAAAAALNIGLAVRVVAEPLARSGFSGGDVDWALVVSGVVQAMAVLGFVSKLWSRAAPKSRVNPRPQPP